ncbi:MAG: hypothetical protein ACI4J0_11340 [Huintestinicola sp.]|uniref:hypothetical protein n=1 Tax=Huintestinicola sp. TaxID=2981661 RepID=UPI003F0BC7D1
MENMNCPCKRTKCERHGNCALCREHHLTLSGRKALTRCEKLRIKEQKKTEKSRERGRL